MNNLARQLEAEKLQQKKEIVIQERAEHKNHYQGNRHKFPARWQTWNVVQWTWMPVRGNTEQKNGHRPKALNNQ